MAGGNFYRKYFFRIFAVLFIYQDDNIAVQDDNIAVQDDNIAVQDDNIAVQDDNIAVTIGTFE